MYKKAAETQERQIFDKKQKMKDALAQGKQLPTELRNDARQMGADLRRDEAQTGECLAHTSEETRKGQLYLYSDEGFRVSVGACNTRSTSKERETRAHCRVFFSRPTDSIHLVARFCSYADMPSLLSRSYGPCRRRVFSRRHLRPQDSPHDVARPVVEASPVLQGASACLPERPPDKSRKLCRQGACRGLPSKRSHRPRCCPRAPWCPWSVMARCSPQAPFRPLLTCPPILFD